MGGSCSIQRRPMFSSHGDSDGHVSLIALTRLDSDMHISLQLFLRMRRVAVGDDVTTRTACSQSVFGSLRFSNRFSPLSVMCISLLSPLGIISTMMYQNRVPQMVASAAKILVPARLVLEPYVTAWIRKFPTDPSHPSTLYVTTTSLYPAIVAHPNP